MSKIIEGLRHAIRFAKGDKAGARETTYANVWWCPTCRCEVPWDTVVFDRHMKSFGGCGGKTFRTQRVEKV